MVVLRLILYLVNNVHVTVFLVSLKAGGVALNLTEASRVYLMDSWWNPAVSPLPSVPRQILPLDHVDVAPGHRLNFVSVVHRHISFSNSYHIRGHGPDSSAWPA
jgi:hypothetical protein